MLLIKAMLQILYTKFIIEWIDKNSVIECELIVYGLSYIVHTAW